MKYKVADIVKDIRKALEFNDESESLINVDDIETLTLNDVVKSKIVDAVKFITNNAPLHLCGTGKSLDEPIVWEYEGMPGRGKGTMVMPDDFMRLLTFQMTDWQKQGTIILDTDPEYVLQQSKHVGLKGNPEAPVVAICHYPEGLTLELYSCVKGREVGIKRASYLPLPCDLFDIIEIPERLYSAVIMYAAYLVAISYSAVSVANSLLKLAYDYAELDMPKPDVEQQS